MAIRRCGWCGEVLGVAPEVEGAETTGVCELCAVKLTADGAISHALLVVRTLEQELERALADVWKPPKEEP